MRPSNTVYLVSPRRIAAMPASRMLSGVSKSGSPCDSAMTSRPAAFNSVARAVIAMVGEGFTRAKRSASRDMACFRRENDRPNLVVGPAAVKRGSVEFGRQIRVAVMREHAADLIWHHPADRQLGGEVGLCEEAGLGGL